MFFFTSKRLFCQDSAENKIETLRATVVLFCHKLKLGSMTCLQLWNWMLQCIFVECFDCDCVSSHTSVSGVYEVTSPVTNNSTLVECVMRDGYGYTVSAAKVWGIFVCTFPHNLCLQTDCTIILLKYLKSIMWTYFFLTNSLNEMSFLNVDINIFAYDVDLDVYVKWNYYRYW